MGESAEPMGFEDLLQHSDWVRGLATRLVGETARADDLVQEAWLAALESPPRHQTNLRGWLGSVVTRLAQSEWRGDRRRTAREQRGSRPEAQPPTDQLVHEAQLSGELVETIVAMAEPFKTVLLMRYFRDQKPGEIARELGRPTATIKTQLQRGLERLRTELDGKYGDRRSWCLAMLPLVRGAVPGSSVGIGSGTWLAAAGLVAVSAWIVLDGNESIEPGPLMDEQALVPASLPPEEDRDPLALLSESTREPAESPPDEVPLAAADTELTGAVGAGSTTHTLSGLILDLDSEPVPGVDIRWIDDGALRWLDERRTVITGAGTWVPLSAARHASLLRDEAALHSFVERNFRRTDLALAFLRGEQPPTFEARSDSRGRFSLQTPQFSYAIELLDHDLDIIGRSKTPDELGRAVQTWFVARRRSFSGTVVDAQGVALEGVRLSATGVFPTALRGRLSMGNGFSSRAFNTTSDEFGRFAFSSVSTGRRVWLSAESPGLAPHGANVDLPGDPVDELEPLQIQLLPIPEVGLGLVLKGRILLDNGSPAARATVVLGFSRNGTTTNLDGEYELSPQHLSGDLYAGRSGSGIAIAAGVGGSLEGLTGQVNIPDLVLPRESLAIDGRVLDSSGAAVEGAEVRVTNGIPLSGRSGSLEALVQGTRSVSVITGEGGRFRIDGLSQRDYELSVRLDLRWAKKESIRAGSGGVAIVLP